MGRRHARLRQLWLQSRVDSLPGVRVCPSPPDQSAAGRAQVLLPGRTIIVLNLFQLLASTLNPATGSFVVTATDSTSSCPDARPKQE